MRWVLRPKMTQTEAKSQDQSLDRTIEPGPGMRVGVDPEFRTNALLLLLLQRMMTTVWQPWTSLSEAG